MAEPFRQKRTVLGDCPTQFVAHNEGELRLRNAVVDGANLWVHELLILSVFGRRLFKVVRKTNEDQYDSKSATMSTVYSKLSKKRALAGAPGPTPAMFLCLVTLNFSSQNKLMSSLVIITASVSEISCGKTDTQTNGGKNLTLTPTTTVGVDNQ